MEGERKERGKEEVSGSLPGFVDILQLNQ